MSVDDMCVTLLSKTRDSHTWKCRSRTIGRNTTENPGSAGQTYIGKKTFTVSLCEAIRKCLTRTVSALNMQDESFLSVKSQIMSQALSIRMVVLLILVKTLVASDLRSTLDRVCSA